MLRAILTAHISPADESRMRVQLNGQDLGHAASSASRNLVVSGNRLVHTASAHYSGRMTSAESAAAALSFQDFFREAQTFGLSYLPAFLRDKRPEADFLFLGSAEILLFWQDRKKGIYLCRDRKFYRLQPIARPQGVFPEGWQPETDFYTVTPKENDLFLILSPDFVSRFRPEQLEDLFFSSQQLHAMMAELNRLGETYGLNFDHTWFALQVKRAEGNIIVRGRAEAQNLGEENSRVSMNREFADFFDRSRVSRVSVSQELIPAAETAPRLRRRKSEDSSVPHARSRGRLGSLRKEEQSALPSPGQRRRRERQETWAAYEARRRPRENVYDQLREFSFDPYIKRGKQLFRRFFLLWPEQPFLSRFFAASCCVLLLLLLLLGFRALSRKPEPLQQTNATLATMVREEAVVGASAQAPEVTNLEIALVVKANNLQIRQSPDPSSALIASIKRGDTLLQLAAEKDGWVYVRAEDGREGYVFAEYLLN